MSRRVVAIMLCVGAAACLLAAAVTDSWLVNSTDQASIRFGLRRNHECLSAWAMGDKPRSRDEAWTCLQASNSETVAKWRAVEQPHGERLASGAFVSMGWVTLIVIVIAALGLLAAASIAAADKQPQLADRTDDDRAAGDHDRADHGCVFVATKPGPPGMVGVGLSFWLFGVGCVMGIAGAQMIAKVNRPPDPEWTVD